MEVTKIIIKTKCGKKITIEPNETHDVTVIESPIVHKVYADHLSFEIAESINSITAIVIHPRNVSTDRIGRAMDKTANNH